MRRGELLRDQLTKSPLMTFPDSPGWKGTETSRQAAEDMAPNAETLRHLAYDVLQRAGQNGLTADECARMLRRDRLSIRPRISELHTMGKIQDSGKRRLNDSGKLVIVWEVC